VGAIAPKLDLAEIERAKRKPTGNLDAYDYYLRAIAAGWTSREGVAEGLRLLQRAIELDSDFASAYGVAAWFYAQRKASGWVIDRDQEIAETERLARRAAGLAKDDAVALSYGGWALAYVVHDLDAAVAFIDRALALNSNLAAAWFASGWLRVWLGKPDVAIEHFARAMRLSPLDPLFPGMRAGTAHAHFFAGHHDEARSWAAMALRETPDFHTGLRIAAASGALAGNAEEATRAIARLRQLDPALRVSNLRDALGPYRRPEDLAKYEDGVRKAGLPE
jgi:adenylate cyclase